MSKYLFSNYKFSLKLFAFLVGLDEVGKTTILYKLKFRRVVETVTTIGRPLIFKFIFKNPFLFSGFNTETVQYKNQTFSILDFGGHAKIRWLWYRYCHEIRAVIFVIDTSDRERMPEVKELFTRLVRFF